MKNAPDVVCVVPELRTSAAALANLPGAPKKVDLRLEMHAQ